MDDDEYDVLLNIFLIIYQFCHKIFASSPSLGIFQKCWKYCFQRLQINVLAESQPTVVVVVVPVVLHSQVSR